MFHFASCPVHDSFSNYAFYAVNTDITSCTRPDLLQNILSTNTSVDDEHNNEIGVFSVSNNIPFLFIVINGDIALDQIQITVAENVSNPIRFGAINGTTLIVDSEIADNHDVAYNGDECTVIYYDRLSNDSSVILRLMMECGSFDLQTADFNDYFNADLDQNAFEGSTATTLWVKPVSSTYFPGMNLEFNLTLTDNTGMVVDDERIQNTTITVVGDSFIGHLIVDENGDCVICEQGLWLSSLSIDDIGDQYTIEITNDNNHFTLGQSQYTFNITGCPIGFGVDSDNTTCDECDDGEYNIDDDSVRECLSCDLGQNPGDVAS